jgi:hypothetical protein
LRLDAGRRDFWLLPPLLVAFWAAYLAVKPTNFGGLDEWIIVHLVSKGIVSWPYANRPLALVWALPGEWLAPGSFDGFRWLGFAYIAVTGAAVFRLCRRLAPRDPSVAVLAAAFTMLWAPADVLRLSTIQGAVHLGFACGATVAVTLFVESYWRRSLALLVVAIGAALATIRSYEAILPVVAAAPLLLPWRQRESRRWTAAWWATAALGAALALVPRLGVSHAYQDTLGLDLQPLSIGKRILLQYWLHLAPLVSALPPPSPTAVVPALAVAVTALIAAREVDEPGALLRLAAAGAAGAGLAYAPYALLSVFRGAMRTQMLSAPWIALSLSALVALGTRGLGPARRWIVALCGAWVVFIGASHMAAMQAEVWDRYGKLPVQRASLAELVKQVPDVKPHTLVVLVGETRDVWPFSFGFRHAVAYLYEDHAAGIVAGGGDGGADDPYRVAFGPQGIAVTPWPEIQRAWGEPATVYRYDEAIVVAVTAPGTLHVLPDWPAGALPGLPPGATYRPASRIVTGGPTIAARGVLRDSLP